MDQSAPTVPASLTVSELAERIARRDPEVCRHQALLVVSDDGKLQAVITRGDILRALDHEPGGTGTVLEAGSSKPIVTYADETLSDAVHKMLRHNIGRLPVVEHGDPRRIVGYLGRPNVMAAHRRRIEEEHVREPGWIGNRAAQGAPETGASE